MALRLRLSQSPRGQRRAARAQSNRESKAQFPQRDPSAILARAFAPAGPIGNRPRIGIVENVETRPAVRLDEMPRLLASFAVRCAAGKQVNFATDFDCGGRSRFVKTDQTVNQGLLGTAAPECLTEAYPATTRQWGNDGLPDFGGFRSAAPFDPLRQRPRRRFARLARPPTRDAQLRRHLARRRNEPKPLPQQALVYRLIGFNKPGPRARREYRGAGSTGRRAPGARDLQPISCRL